MEDHPILSLLERGVLVTVNSDDPAYFGGYVNSNYLAVAEALAPSHEQVTQIARNSFTASFLDQRDKDNWLEEIDAIEIWREAGPRILCRIRGLFPLRYLIISTGMQALASPGTR